MIYRFEGTTTHIDGTAVAFTVTAELEGDMVQVNAFIRGVFAREPQLRRVQAYDMASLVHAPASPRCVLCQCDELHACYDETTGLGCSWVVVDYDNGTGLCSVCARKHPEALQTIAAAEPG